MLLGVLTAVAILAATEERTADTAAAAGDCLIGISLLLLLLLTLARLLQELRHGWCQLVQACNRLLGHCLLLDTSGTLAASSCSFAAGLDHTCFGACCYRLCQALVFSGKWAQ